MAEAEDKDGAGYRTDAGITKPPGASEAQVSTYEMGVHTYSCEMHE